jgi:hypothetical protein
MTIETQGIEKKLPQLNRRYLNEERKDNRARWSGTQVGIKRQDPKATLVWGRSPRELRGKHGRPRSGCKKELCRLPGPPPKPAGPVKLRLFGEQNGTPRETTGVHGRPRSGRKKLGHRSQALYQNRKNDHKLLQFGENG